MNPHLSQQTIQRSILFTVITRLLHMKKKCETLPQNSSVITDIITDIITVVTLYIKYLFLKIQYA